MSTAYPGAIDSTNLTNPNTTDKRNSPSLAGAQSNQNDAIKAVQTKIGTGASTPVANTLLFGTGTGTSAWTQLTSAQLAASLTDETGTGSNVFANTPTLVTPKVDTINEATGGNGTTIGGVNIKSGALNTANSVVTTNITDANVTTAKLAAAAVTDAKLAFGKVRTRQGGSSTIWSTTGTTTFDTTAVATFIQVGTIAAGASPQVITFPIAFSFAPLVVATTVALTANCFCTIASVNTTSVSIQVVTDAGVGNTAQAVNWIAIGQ